MGRRGGVLGADAHRDPARARDLARGIDQPVRAFGLYADAVPRLRDAGRVGRRSLPARDLLPPLDRYARLDIDGEQRLVGAVLATHGCAHRCRHCPVPVVFDGRVRRVDEDAVLADIAQLVAAGAEHITFGDPDFLNAPPHARRIVAAMHERFPDVTFDCTVKVEHVLRHADLWPEFAASGCVFVVSAFESVDDAVLERLDKGHTAADAARAVTILRDAGIEVRPSWLPFTPWTTRDDLVALLDFVYDHDLVGSIDPVQYSVRLLLPEGSLLLDHPDLTPFVGPWDAERSTYTWASPGSDDRRAAERIAAIVATATTTRSRSTPGSARQSGAPPSTSRTSRPAVPASPRAGSAAPNPPTSSSRDRRARGVARTCC